MDKKKVMELLRAMTVEEKAGLCSGLDFWHLKGVERLGVPSILVCDGPHGLRKQEFVSDHVGLNESNPATCFPTASLAACSWDRELIYQMGTYLGKECQSEGVSVLLGPGANIKRSPLCGRNFEYFSEDPYLTGELAASFIKGVQSEGVGTSLKHYAVNNQEKNRLSIDAVVDERTLREIYLTGFEKAVKEAQPWTVMCSYNKVNGEFASENEYLLTSILKNEWGHEGIVVTDWGACNDRVYGVKCGNELEMPSSCGINDKKIVEAVKNGELDEAILDSAIARVLGLILRAEENKKIGVEVNYDQHHAFAKQVACDSIVLLKNDNNVLPLKKEDKIAIIGEFAKKPRYQGAGSSHINPTKLDSAYLTITNEIDKDQILYADGYKIEEDDEDNHSLIKEAVEIAKSADSVIVFTGLPGSYESEGFDRSHLRLPRSHNDLIEAVSKVNNQVIVVLSNGAPVEMPWINNVNGIIEAYLGGQAGASAVVDILFGGVNPSGKLAESFPLNIEDNSSYKNFPGESKKVEYREGIYVGYRYYDKVNKDVLFPFGYGLSYTSFEYSELRVSSKSIRDTDVLSISFKVKNIGSVTGKEISQVYVKDVETTLFRPDKELKGFEKIALEPGEEKEVAITLDKRAFAYYNIELADWCVETGEFEILIGASSRDIRLKEVVRVTSTLDYDEAKNELNEHLPSYYDLKDEILNIPKDEFQILYGRQIPEYNQAEYTMNSTFEDVRQHRIGKYIVKTILWIYSRQQKGNNNDTATKRMMETMIVENPIRGLIYTSEGQFTEEMGELTLAICNGKDRFRALMKFVGSLFKRKD